MEAGADRRVVRLPRGRWYDTVTGRAYEGPGPVVVDAPLSRIPVLARAGAVIPVRDADGELELEVWAPAPGRSGGGLVVRDPGDGWAEAELERYVARWEGAAWWWSGTVAGRGPGGRSSGAGAGVAEG